MRHLPPLQASVLLFALALLALPASSIAAIALAGYQTDDEFKQSLNQLSQGPCVSLSSLGKTAEGRDIHLLAVSAGDAAGKPAVLLVGSVDAANLVGSELAVRIVEQLVHAYGNNDPAAMKLLEEVTLYVVPRPSPDASAHVLDVPIAGRATNSRSTDADRDGSWNEDPHEDLNDDGVITSLRVADPTGPWIEHPDDPRVLVRADSSKNETGQYRLYSEGVDNDRDEMLNEDGAGGIDFNYNFPFEYPYFAGDAGPHQVSEPETRAIADWMFTRPNIFLVFSFSPQDNLTKPWPVAKDNGGRIKRQVLKEDAAVYQFLAKNYGKQGGSKNAPDAAGNGGAFAPWAYYHYGRWSISTRGWWIPEVETRSGSANSESKQPGNAEQDGEHAEDHNAEENRKVSDEDAARDDVGESESQESSSDSLPPAGMDSADKHSTDRDSKATKSDEQESKPDGRNAEDRNALAWFAANGIDGFVDWTAIDHPDFPGKKVEVGGFKPLVREHPPAEQLGALATRHWAFLAETIDLRAKLEFEPAEIESLGAGVYRVTAAVINRGFLPTASAMGRTAGTLQRLDLEIMLPAGGQLLTGHARERLGVLAGNGGRAEQQWLLRLATPEATGEATLRVGEPGVGFIDQRLELEPSEEPEHAS